MTVYAPRHVDIWPWTNVFSSVGTWARATTSNVLGLGYIQSTSAAQNDDVVYNVALDAGVWTLTVICRRDASFGIATFYLDSTSLGTVDFYRSSLLVNSVHQITGFTVATPAVYALKMKMETKNASASAYGFNVNLLTLTRTGA